MEQTEQQIQRLQAQIQEEMADVAATMIFNAHLLILSDDQFTGRMRELIKSGTPVRQAVADVAGDYIRTFSESQMQSVREKAQDIRDLAQRLLANLETASVTAGDFSGRIVIADEILPSEILKLHAERVAGLILLSGSVTAHVTILARSFELPLVIVKEPELLLLPPDTPLLIDATQGNVFIRPEPATVASYRELQETRQQAAAQSATAAAQTYTGDGERVYLTATVNLVSDLALARRFNAEGIGLYRSEFPYIIRNEFPSEEEQFVIYRRILDEMPDQMVTFRTLDVGGDKMLSYFPNVGEANPFLGLRALRFSLRYRGIFEQQLRALLRAGATRPFRIMFPMVASVDDFLQARLVVAQCREALSAAGIVHNTDSAELGAMIEVPSVVGVIEELAQETDFLSIGSNDLVQYMLAVDRTNKHLQDFYVTHHPSVLRALHRIAEAARQAGKPVSVCGEMASDKDYLPILLGLGIRHLSLESRKIPAIQQLISTLHVPACRQLAAALVSQGTIAGVEAELDKWRHRAP